MPMRCVWNRNNRGTWLRRGGKRGRSRKSQSQSQSQSQVAVAVAVAVASRKSQGRTCPSRDRKPARVAAGVTTRRREKHYPADGELVWWREVYLPPPDRFSLRERQWSWLRRRPSDSGAGYAVARSSPASTSATRSSTPSIPTDSRTRFSGTASSVPRTEACVISVG